jgi:hypothetical protein
MSILQNSINANSTTPLHVVQGGTGLSSTTASQILYSSAANTIAGLATANNGTLVTSGAGVPSISSTLPTAVQTNITELGTVTVGTYSAVMQDYTETNTASTQSSTYARNLASGNVFSLTLSGNVTLSFSNVPASGCASVTLFLIQDGTGSRTVTWPGSVIWPGGTAPTLTTTANHVDLIVMMTTNAGTTWRASSVLNYSS